MAVRDLLLLALFVTGAFAGSSSSGLPGLRPVSAGSTGGMLKLGRPGGPSGLPDPGLYSPQRSPGGAHVLWESLARGGSIWITGPHGEQLTFVVVGHSPSWESALSFRFVVSRDDGHQVVDDSLYRYDLASGSASLLAQHSGNPDYHSVPTSS